MEVVSKRGESTVIQARQLQPLAGRAAACCCGVSALLTHFCDWPGLSCDPVWGVMVGQAERVGVGMRFSKLTNSRRSKQNLAILEITKKN